MCVIDLVRKVKFEGVAKAIMYFYPDTPEKVLKKYKRIFKEIASMKRVRTDKEEFVQICAAENPGEEGMQYYKVDTNKYSMMFRSWSSLCSLRIGEEELQRYTANDLLAHFLWEITYSGFTEKEIQKKAKKMSEALKEIS